MIRSIQLVRFSIFLFGIVGIAHCEAANQVTTAEENSSNREEVVQKICERTLELASEVPSGDEGFIKLFSLVTEIVTKENPKLTVRENNEAAILSLAILIGEDRVRTLARFRFTLNPNEVEKLRSRITLRKRNDLARHFWVSAGLTILSGEKQALAVGVGKEVMDSTPGGSGFSFVDLLADQAGIRFAANAMRDEASAIAIKDLIEQKLEIQDVFPSIDELPEGISAERFQAEFGGMGGKKTRELLKDMQARLESCKALTKRP
jgi:uncharacterized protein YfiM (DUF2279 family)